MRRNFGVCDALIGFYSFCQAQCVSRPDPKIIVKTFLGNIPPPPKLFIDAPILRKTVLTPHKSMPCRRNSIILQKVSKIGDYKSDARKIYSRVAVSSHRKCLYLWRTMNFGHPDWNLIWSGYVTNYYFLMTYNAETRRNSH